MDIETYLENVEGEWGRFVLLIVTPKNKFPRNFLDNDYHVFLKKILTTPEYKTISSGFLQYGY
ncbi:hypothetical protein [Peribacillus butanolivorans]|uniref:hypothetical protein n=1 Tax=Peribacillus butanolivorans TaxID=421767 RepID=UPI0036DF6BFB